MNSNSVGPQLTAQKLASMEREATNTLNDDLQPNYVYVDDQNNLNDDIDDETGSSDSYGSDNDDIVSDEMHFDYPMEEAIGIPLDKAGVDRFHQYLYGYFDCTRSSQKGCSDRYDILCLMNEVWQKVLIQREFSKNDLNEKTLIAAGCTLQIDDVYADDIEYSPYKVRHGSVEWLTPCSAPTKRVVWRDAAGKILFDRIIPSAKIFGSICTRLDCEGSDMDITLPNSVDCPVIDIWFNKSEQKQKLNEFLNILKQRISDQKSLNERFRKYRFEIYPILNAKVPIIKIKEVGRTGLDMDIAIQSSQQSVANLINFYCDCDDRVRPFIIAIKHWSKRRGLCDAMNNYPNSFGFVLLCIKFLQMVNLLPVCQIEVDERDAAQPRVVHPVDSSKPNTDTLLELMVQFFEMYRRFNFKLLQISTSTPGLESKICHQYYSTFKTQRQTTMVVQDPSCISANVTRNVRPYRLTIMQNEFFRGYKCAKHGDWDLLMAKFTTAKTEVPIFNFYPPSDDEQQHLYDVLMKRRGLEPDQGQSGSSALSDSFEYDDDDHEFHGRWSGEEAENSPIPMESVQDKEQRDSVSKQVVDNEDQKDERSPLVVVEEEALNELEESQDAPCDGPGTFHYESRISRISSVYAAVDIEEETVQMTNEMSSESTVHLNGYEATVSITDDEPADEEQPGGPVRSGYKYPMQTKGKPIEEVEVEEEEGDGTEDEEDNDDDEKVDQRYALKFGKALVLRLDKLLMDHHIDLILRLTPIKNELFVDGNRRRINLEHLDSKSIERLFGRYALSMVEFVRICKYYIVNFNVQFMAFYKETIEENETLRNNEKAMFDLLDYGDPLHLQQSEGRESMHFQIQCLEEFVKFNNDHYFRTFLDEFHFRTRQNRDEAVPIAMEELMVRVAGDNQCESLILNYSWYISVISLFAFWKTLFADIDEMANCSQNRIVSVSRMADSEWVMPKIKDSMTVLGLQYLSREELLPTLKALRQ